MLALLVTTAAWAGGSLYARGAALPASPLLSASMQMLAASAFLAVAGLAKGEARAIHTDTFSTKPVIAFVYLVLVGSLIAFSAYAWLLKNASSSLLSTYAYVNPAVAVFLGWALVGEHVGGKEVAAGLVILSSIILLVFGRGPRAAAEPIAESLAPYIRRKDAQIVEFPRPVPRLAELRRIVA